MSTKQKIIELLVSAVDIPPSYYQTAHTRYEDLGKWFGREGSLTGRFAPRVYGQGSFRLGTVVRPITDSESYDLDMGCRLESGVSKSAHSQKQLKELVGAELKAYREARRIEQPLDEKPRCWRLEYADQLSFHMDVVPSIPEETEKRASLARAMESYGLEKELSASVSHHSGNITDTRLPNYAKVDPDWRISNSEGYALWFESRMSVSKILMEKVAGMAIRAKVEKLPSWEWKSPLQQAIQLLKRHRDVMFKSAPDSKPISIILTTLSAKAYQGEADIGAALESILSRMDSFILPAAPRIPNPVNPNEDFSDKWSDPKHRSLDLEGNFRRWLVQARANFSQFDKLSSREALEKFLWDKFRIRLSGDDLDALARLLPGAGIYLGRTNHHRTTCPPLVGRLRVMNEGGLESFLSQQPHMSLQPSAEGTTVIEGEFCFASIRHGLPEVRDSYCLRIEVPREFPRALPKVTEVGGRIPKQLDFHVSSNGTLCLGSDFNLMIRLQAEPNLSAYASKCIVPYLYAMSLKLDHQVDFAFGELKHGADGLVDDYAALFGLKNKSQVVAALRCLLLKKRIANKKPCPCGCVKRLGKCKFNERIKYFRRLFPKTWVRSYLAGKTVGNLMTED